MGISTAVGQPSLERTSVCSRHILPKPLAGMMLHGGVGVGDTRGVAVARGGVAVGEFLRTGVGVVGTVLVGVSLGSGVLVTAGVRVGVRVGVSVGVDVGVSVGAGTRV